MMKKIYFIIIMLVVSKSLLAQTTNIFFSPPFDKLIIGTTTMKEVEKILGVPTYKWVPNAIKLVKDKKPELDYDNTKSILYFEYKSYILKDFRLKTGSPITINNNITLGKSDTSAVLKTLGTPIEITVINGKTYYDYKTNSFDIVFIFDEKGVLYKADFQKLFPQE